MKYFSIFFWFWNSCIIGALANDVCEDKTLDFGHWHCESNGDGTVNVTYDCLNAKKPVEIWIWSDKLPKDLNALTIQNCEALNLNLHKGEQSFGEFRHLNVVNISELTISPQCSNYQCNPNRCLPTNAIFTNLTINNFRGPLIHNSFCENQNIILKLLQFKNVLIDKMGTYAISLNSLRQFRMDGVKINSIETRAISITNKKTSITITNSEIELIEGDFISCKVFEVTISNSTIQHFNEKFYDKEYNKVFILEADKILLNGNKMKILSDNTFKMISNDIKITDNIFQRVDEKAFDNIAPTKPATNSSLVISNSFNFSNNIIYSLAPGALMIPVQNTSRNALFTNITIFNNSVNCTCENMFWFESVSQNKNNVRNYFNYKWAKKTNQNKCLNIPKCDVSQVLNNFHELCEDPYKCPEMIISEGKEKVLNFINYNNEMGRETSKLMEILINQMEESKIFKDSDDTNQKMFFQSLKKSLIQEEQKWMNVLNLNQISSCLLIITCLCCGVLGYILIAKCWASPFLQTLTLKYRTRSFLSETEMNPSSTSEFN